jgi:hypothetical protein
MIFQSFSKRDMSGAAALADVIPGMRALLSLDMSKNNYLDVLGEQLQLSQSQKDIKMVCCIVGRYTTIQISIYAVCI